MFSNFKPKRFPFHSLLPGSLGTFYETAPSKVEYSRRYFYAQKISIEYLKSTYPGVLFCSSFMTQPTYDPAIQTEEFIYEWYCWSKRDLGSLLYLATGEDPQTYMVMNKLIFTSPKPPPVPKRQQKIPTDYKLVLKRHSWLVFSSQNLDLLSHLNWWCMCQGEVGKFRFISPHSDD